VHIVSRTRTSRRSARLESFLFTDLFSSPCSLLLSDSPFGSCRVGLQFSRVRRPMQTPAPAVPLAAAVRRPRGNRRAIIGACRRACLGETGKSTAVSRSLVGSFSARRTHVGFDGDSLRVAVSVSASAANARHAPEASLLSASQLLLIFGIAAVGRKFHPSSTRRGHAWSRRT